MLEKRRLNKCIDEDAEYEEKIETLDDFDADEYKNKIETNIESRIEKYLNDIEINKAKAKIKSEVRDHIKDKYFKDGIPYNLPYIIRDLLGIDEDEACMEVEDCRAVEMSDEDIKKLQDKVKEYQKRQNDIVDIILDKEKYLSKDNRNLIGSYVSEYKKIEGLKSNYLDRLQAAYTGDRIRSFDIHFSENNTDCNSRF